MNRKIKFHKHYFVEFYQNLDSKVQEKIEHVFYIITNCEIRIQYSNNIFRIFCFFDQGNLVVLLHGIQKKSQKIPMKEIIKAKKLRQEYYDEKG